MSVGECACDRDSGQILGSILTNCCNAGSLAQNLGWVRLRLEWFIIFEDQSQQRKLVKTLQF